MSGLKDESWVESGVLLSALILDCELSWNAGYEVPLVVVEVEVEDDDDALLIKYSSDDTDAFSFSFAISFSFSVSFVVSFAVAISISVPLDLLVLLPSGLYFGCLNCSSVISMNI